jgi:hypothetical protein
MIDPLAKAAECENAIKVCTDPDNVPVLTNLRELWLAIASHRAAGLVDWEAHAAHLDKLHVDIVGSPK